MTLPANWTAGQQFTASAENAVEAAVNSNTAARPQEGTFASLPTPGNAGSVYLCTDTGLLLRDNGTSWDRWGGKLNKFTAPPSGLSTTTMGSDTLAANKDARLLNMAASGSAWRVEYQTLSPTSNYTATAYLEYPGSPGANAWLAGLILMASNGTTLIGFGVGNNATTNTVFVFGATSLTGISATQASATPLVVPNWFRIRDDGTNNNFEYSLNGMDWQNIFSAGRTSYLTPARIGWGGINTSGSAVTARLRSFNVTTP